MSDRELGIAEKVSAAIPEMTDFDKGYLLGKVEEMAAAKQRRLEEEKRLREQAAGPGTAV